MLNLLYILSILTDHFNITMLSATALSVVLPLDFTGGTVPNPLYTITNSANKVSWLDPPLLYLSNLLLARCVTNI